MAEFKNGVQTSGCQKGTDMTIKDHKDLTGDKTVLYLSCNVDYTNPHM